MDAKDRRIAELETLLRTALERITELERRLGLNSRNSSKPPSSDGYKKPSPKSLRCAGQRRSGGQIGHAGKTLGQTETPDWIVEHHVKSCNRCQKDLEAATPSRYVCRQVFDIPEPKIEVTEHRAEVKICDCGCVNTGLFPKEVNAPVQYGKRVMALAVYLSVQQMIPEDRLQIAFMDIFGLTISTATLVRFNEIFAKKISSEVDQKLEVLKKASVKHVDETGIRIAGKLHWLHVICSDQLTHYRISEKRGDLLEDLEGIISHDHWKPYFTLENVTHSLCNAHHLRALKALEEDSESWAFEMSAFLKNSAHHSKSPPPNFMAEAYEKYDDIVSKGLAFHEALPPFPKPARGRQKRRPGHNLLLRFQNFKDDVLRFLTDPSIPFTNNQAEQDIRMMKVKQKISGSFRTLLGAQIFCTIRSFLSSSRKQNLNLFVSIKFALT